MFGYVYIDYQKREIILVHLVEPKYANMLAIIFSERETLAQIAYEE